MASDLTIRKAQRQVNEYLQAKGEKWTKLSNHYLRVTHLVEEVGELARGVINLDAEYSDPNRRGISQPTREKLAYLQDSLGDILYHLLAISISYNVDLETAFTSSMNNILTRYPIPSTSRLDDRGNLRKGEPSRARGRFYGLAEAPSRHR